LIYIVVIGGVFVFMTSRGNRKRQSQASQLQSALVVGAQVRTIGGVVGEVIDVDDEHVVVETTPGVRLKFVKNAVAGVIAPAEAEDELETADTDEADDTDEAENDESTVAEHEAEPSDEVPAHEPEAEEDAARRGASEPAKR
jgi:preprotein translocase subunit YajC